MTTAAMLLFRSAALGPAFGLRAILTARLAIGLSDRRKRGLRHV